jgi:sulfur carrier protein ThiS
MAVLLRWRGLEQPTETFAAAFAGRVALGLRLHSGGSLHAGTGSRVRDRAVSDPSAALIQVNGQPLALSAKHLAALLHERGVNTAGKGIGVALNGTVVPRAIGTLSAT